MHLWGMVKYGHVRAPIHGMSCSWFDRSGGAPKFVFKKHPVLQPILWLLPFVFNLARQRRYMGAANRVCDLSVRDISLETSLQFSITAADDAIDLFILAKSLCSTSKNPASSLCKQHLYQDQRKTQKMRYATLTTWSVPLIRVILQPRPLFLVVSPANG